MEVRMMIRRTTGVVVAIVVMMMMSLTSSSAYMVIGKRSIGLTTSRRALTTTFVINNAKRQQQSKRSSNSALFITNNNNNNNLPLSSAITNRKTVWLSSSRFNRLYSATVDVVSSSSPSTNKDDNNIIVSNAAAEEETIELPTNENDEELLKIRHSTAHIMAMAVQKLYPNEAQVTIGPWIDNGYYYDFYFKANPETGEQRKLSDADLKQIQKEMDYIIKQNFPITREEVTRDEAHRRITELGEPFKLELLDSIKTEPITIYHIGDQWWDLCAGPHVESTGAIPRKAYEVQSVAGAYWRGDETREQLQRIYGTVWKNPQQLKYYKQQLAEAKKRDHRLLGKKLDLFSIQQESAGGGLVFWHPRGSKIRNIIETFWKQSHIDAGYELVYSPHVANLDLWKTSGHFDFYRADMFEPIAVENELYQLKPMNCPFHCLMYKNELRSYRDLPYRWAELGTVYRYERSGTLHGLMRVRGFTQDDAHIFCLPDQLQDEIIGVLDLTERILTRFGFNKYHIMLSTRPEKSVGSDEIWDAATTALRGALETKGWQYGIDEGGGAFYGPKIDVKIRDAIGRMWQCSTIQCDFNLPERFDLEYVAPDSSRQRPIMVHRAIFGSMERFFGILIENCAGDFPLWLAPTQLKLLPVTDAAQDYCDTIAKQARAYNIRVEVDRGNERLGKQIRNAEQQRIPLIGVIGTKEIENNTVTIRSRKNGDLGAFDVTELLHMIQGCSDQAIEMTTIGIKEEAPTTDDNNTPSQEEEELKE